MPTPYRLEIHIDLRHPSLVKRDGGVNWAALNSLISIAGMRMLEGKTLDTSLETDGKLVIYTVVHQGEEDA